MKKLHYLILALVVAAGLYSQPTGPKTTLKSNQVAITVASPYQEKLEPLAFTPPGTITALVNTPTSGTVVLLFRNGVLQKDGQDFTLNGRTITPTFPADWASDDTILCYYKHK